MIFMHSSSLPEREGWHPPKVSVVVPALNEIRALPDTLDQLLGDAELAQIIVADGGSSDGTDDYVRSLQNPRVSLVRSPRGRGPQMNAGAAGANGDWLLFHHADTRLPARAGSLLQNLPSDVQWGGFRHQFSHGNWKLRMISGLHNWRCRRTGVMYGDQSMFVRRSLFDSIGGFAATGLEDLQFSDAALLRAPSHLMEAAVVTDSRKFRQIGELRALCQVLSIIWRYERHRKLGNAVFFEPYR